MIVDSPFIAALATGADRVIPQEGDSQIVVPAVFLAAIEPLTGHNVSNLSTDIATTSRLGELIIAQNNQAASFSALITLPKGLYTVEYAISVRFSFTPVAPLTAHVQLHLFYQNFAITLDSISGFTGSFRMDGSRRFLLTSTGRLEMAFPITGAAEFIDGNVGWNVVRHI